MTSYELMIKTNHYLIKGGELTDLQKNTIIKQLLSAQSDERTKQSFYKGVRFLNNTDDNGRRMYPDFFIPPYNDGKKLKTVLNQTPKTHIFSANMYELEILRLLYLLSPQNLEIQQMVTATLKRLETTCFGYQDDSMGECFDTSLVVLRFLSTIAPNNTVWIKSRIDNYNDHANEKNDPGFHFGIIGFVFQNYPLKLQDPR